MIFAAIDAVSEIDGAGNLVIDREALIEALQHHRVRGLDWHADLLRDR